VEKRGSISGSSEPSSAWRVIGKERHRLSCMLRHHLSRLRQSSLLIIVYHYRTHSAWISLRSSFSHARFCDIHSLSFAHSRIENRKKSQPISVIVANDFIRICFFVAYIFEVTFILEFYTVDFIYIN